MSKSLFVGVDGGATKCVVRLEDEAGQCLGTASSGPANIRLSVEQAWQSIEAGMHAILQAAAISPTHDHLDFHAGMGLAGSEIPEAYQAFLARPHLFKTLYVCSDAHIACLGAHAGQDGGIIIAGTGTIAYQIQGEQVTRVGGFGFPHDDEGGGAWLGLQAVMRTLRWLDGRSQGSALEQSVYAHFQQDSAVLIRWANQATSTQYATLAPLIVQQSQAGNVVAQQLLQQAALALDDLAKALALSGNTLPIVLCGGMAPFLQPYVGDALQSRLTTRQLSADQGAILMLRERFTQSKERV